MPNDFEIDRFSFILPQDRFDEKKARLTNTVPASEMNMGIVVLTVYEDGFSALNRDTIKPAHPSIIRKLVARNAPIMGPYFTNVNIETQGQKFSLSICPTRNFDDLASVYEAIYAANLECCDIWLDGMFVTTLKWSKVTEAHFFRDGKYTVSKWNGKYLNIFTDQPSSALAIHHPEYWRVSPILLEGEFNKGVWVLTAKGHDFSLGQRLNSDEPAVQSVEEAEAAIKILPYDKDATYFIFADGQYVKTVQSLENKVVACATTAARFCENKQVTDDVHLRVVSDGVYNVFYKGEQKFKILVRFPHRDEVDLCFGVLNHWFDLCNIKDRFAITEQEIISIVRPYCFGIRHSEFFRNRDNRCYHIFENDIHIGILWVHNLQPIFLPSPMGLPLISIPFPTWTLADPGNGLEQLIIPFLVRQAQDRMAKVEIVSRAGLPRGWPGPGTTSYSLKIDDVDVRMSIAQGLTSTEICFYFNNRMRSIVIENMDFSDEVIKALARNYQCDIIANRRYNCVKTYELFRGRKNHCLLTADLPTAKFQIGECVLTLDGIKPSQQNLSVVEAATLMQIALKTLEAIPIPHNLQVPWSNP